MMLPTYLDFFACGFRILASYNPTNMFFSWCVRENSLHLPSLNL